MLDHAARRVSIGHSWIKRAEAQRRRFEKDAERLDAVPAGAAAWLDAFIAERSGTSGATTARGEYRIRRRAIEGWEEVVERWKRASCRTEDDRIAAAREAQADPEIDKFGDIQLFEALAADDAVCVWRQNGEATPGPLRDYVLGHDARVKQLRFKVPAYRHPDPLRHPVFCDFGNSRWDIEYAVHEAAKALGAKRPPAADSAAWLKDRQGMRMGLWDGNTVQKVSLRWSSKRLTKDLAREPRGPEESVQVVGRADRLGRAASGVKPDEGSRVAGLFKLDDWNGRLQAPRAQLDAIAACIDRNNGRWNDKARKLRNRIEWLATFSAKLECRGPFMEYAARFSDGASARPFISRKGELAVKHATNDNRQGHAKIILSRLPGLRVLSVDLGHRFAAACAVWEALPDEQFGQEVKGRGVIAGGVGANDLFCHTRHADPTGKERTTIYRRIAPDRLPDGSVHPAPWARLDRQFLIRLQGEERPARAATNGKLKDGSPTETNEIEIVAQVARDLGVRRGDADESTDRGVDELMRRAVRIAMLGLRRHGRMAKIAYAFRPDCPGIPGMGGDVTAITRGDDDHVRFITNALADWHALATDTHWDGSAARQLWNEHIHPAHGGFEIADPTPADPDAERLTPQQRRKSESELRERLKPIAQHFANNDSGATRAICDAWVKAWKDGDGNERTKDDFRHTIRDENGRVVGSRTTPKPGKESPGGWYSRLRLLTDWIMGWHLPDAQSKHWNRNVGGLSLTRIATMRALYQLHKAFAMRPRPDKVQGAPERGESNVGTAQSILDAMERMREQRVKQIASRIVEAALGVGIERDRVWDGEKKKWRYAKRPRSLLYYEDGQGTAHGDPRFKACHAVVIENLRNYRPDDLQTRRENRAIMNWSAGKVRKYLEEACQLHGLHLREVVPNYTSRQCSRTGLPGVRCVDVPVDEFLTAPWWKKAVRTARKKVVGGSTDAEARFLVELHDQRSATPQQDRRGRVVRVPRRGGDLFVSVPPLRDINGEGSKDSRGGAIQADLNAAANIGLRALLDPDFAGRWWYLPATLNGGWRVPAPKSCAGAACLDGWTVAQADGCYRADGQPIAVADDETVKQAEEAEAAAKKEHDAARKAAKKAGTDQAALTAAKARYEKAKEAAKEAKKAASQKEIVNFWQDPCAGRPAPSAGRWWETTAYWNDVKARAVAMLRRANGLPALDNNTAEAGLEPAASRR
jgi:IS605 OrfB family transposase